MYVVNGLPLVLSRNLTTRYEDDHGRARIIPFQEDGGCTRRIGMAAVAVSFGEDLM